MYTHVLDVEIYGEKKCWLNCSSIKKISRIVSGDSFLSRVITVDKVKGTAEILLMMFYDFLTISWNI